MLPSSKYFPHITLSVGHSDDKDDKSGGCHSNLLKLQAAGFTGHVTDIRHFDRFPSLVYFSAQASVQPLYILSLHVKYPFSIIK